jgi:O-antigen ligase
MKTNVGGLDRMIRAVLGALLIALTLMGTIGVWGWIGVVLLGTAAIGWCPPYQLLGINTCSVKKT